mmetsp:Transcript_8030/g.15126  ORF Transcript_8030/g.15126 Transcript_8030/m.15126 type:complete len:244 (-) Transcript_8030:85-816(-)
MSFTFIFVSLSGIFLPTIILLILKTQNILGFVFLSPSTAIATRTKLWKDESGREQLESNVHLIQNGRKKHLSSCCELRYSLHDGNIGDFNSTAISDDGISRTCEILAKRIVHRGFAMLGQRYRRQQAKAEMDLQREIQKLENKKQSLELKWNIDKSNENCDTDDILSCSEPCEVCRGKGVITCLFCQGHGYVDFGQQDKGTVGSRMEKKNGGHTGIECPICNEDGEMGCQKCNGSGWIALWKI